MKSCSDFRRYASCHMCRGLAALLPTQVNPGGRQFTANQWEDLKENTSVGGGWTALIRKTPKVFYRFRESFVCVFISLMKNQMSNSFKFTLWRLKYSCFSPSFFVYSLTSPIRSLCLSPIPSFLSFLHLSSPNSSLVYLCVLPCPRPAPIGYHLTWQCVLAPYSGKGMLLSLPLYTISLSWNTYTPCSLCMTI